MAGNSKNDSSVSLLMIVLGIAIALLSYLFVFNPCMEDKDKYNEEIDVLDGLIAERTEKKAKENFYNEQIKILEDTRAKVLKYFPADIKAEDDLLFCKELEDKTQFYFTLNGSFDNPIIFYADTGSSLVGYTRKCSYGFAVSYESLAEIDENRPKLTKSEKEEVEIQIKYEGYIKMQEEQVEKFKKTENYENVKQQNDTDFRLKTVHIRQKSFLAVFF